MFLFTLITSFSFADSNIHYNWKWENYKNVDIEICPDSKITKEKVLESIQYWDKRGVTLNITNIKNVNYCDLNKINVIQVSDYRGDFNIEKYHAVTDIEWHYYGDRSENTIYYIDRVHIQLPNDTLNKDVVIFHEFGHALGLGHSENDSVMKKRYDG